MTGGANGIGRAIAIELARQGCNVAVADINYESAQNTSEDLCKLGVKSYAYKVNIILLVKFIDFVLKLQRFACFQRLMYPNKMK